MLFLQRFQLVEEPIPVGIRDLGGVLYVVTPVVVADAMAQFLDTRSSAVVC